VVYSSADKEFAELIFRAYEQKTGVKVLPPSTPAHPARRW